MKIGGQVIRVATLWMIAGALEAQTNLIGPMRVPVSSGTTNPGGQGIVIDSAPTRIPMTFPSSEIDSLQPKVIFDRPTMTLDDAERLAQELNPNLREALAGIDQARGQAVQVGLYPNPTINHGSPQLTGSISQYMQFATQEIVTAHKLRLNRAAASRQVDQAELTFVRTRFDVLTTVRSVFFIAMAAQRRVEVLKKLVEVSKQSQESAQRLFQGTIGTRTDVLLLDIELQRAEVALQNAEAILAATKRQLAAVIGDPRLNVPTLVANFDQVMPQYALEPLREQVLDVNALVEIAMIDINRYQILLRRARVEPIPNITLMGGYQYQVEVPGQNQGLYQVTLPIPVWNRNQGNIQTARASVSRASQALERVRNDLSAQTADVFGRYRAAQQLVDRYQTQIVPKADENFSLANRAYQGGQFDFLRLLQSQRALVDANLGLVNALEGRWTAAAEIGGLLQLEDFPPPTAGQPSSAPSSAIPAPVDPGMGEWPTNPRALPTPQDDVKPAPAKSPQPARDPAKESPKTAPAENSAIPRGVQERRPTIPPAASHQPAPADPTSNANPSETGNARLESYRPKWDRR